MRVCGQWFDEAVRARITAVVQRTPEINRSALARQVCEWLGWRDARGQLQVGGARKALVELHRRGVIALPPSNRQPRTPKSGSPVPLDPAVQAASRCRRAIAGLAGGKPLAEATSTGWSPTPVI